MLNVMKKFLQGAILPFAIFAFILGVVGCDPRLNADLDADRVDEQQTSNDRDTLTHTNDEDEHTSTLAQPETSSELKNGNVFYIARDVANMQMNTGDYISALKASQQELQQAIDTQNPQQLQTAAKALQQQLTGFNQALNQLDLKSQEIYDIRENVIAANTQILQSPLMNGDLNLSQVDFKQLKQQMNTVQSEMLKLATLVIPTAEKTLQKQSS